MYKMLASPPDRAKAALSLHNPLLPPQFVFQYLMLIIFIHKSSGSKEVTDVSYANAVQ